MPLYYFDVKDGAGFHRDEFGDDFDSFDDAREHAQGLLPDIVRRELPDGELHTVSCDIRDGTGRVVYRGKITYEGERFPPDKLAYVSAPDRRHALASGLRCLGFWG